MASNVSLFGDDLALYVVAAGVRLGLILVVRSDLLGFHCVTRMVTQGIGFCRSRYSLD